MEDLVASGVELMLLGMSAVFIFLSLLVLATSTMSRVVMNIAKGEASIGSNPAGNVNEVANGSTVQTDVDEELVTVIATAVKKYRSRH